MPQPQRHPQKLPQQQQQPQSDKIRQRRDIPPPSVASSASKKRPSLTPRQRAYAASAAQKAQWDNLTFQWQTKLFDGAVPASTLKAAASFLTGDDYADVVIERVADKTCGYPLCANPITPAKGRYRISRAERKVYDTTLLRNFCSSVCLAASDYYARQLSDEPPYMRAPVMPSAAAAAADAQPAMDNDVHVIPIEFATATLGRQEGVETPLTRKQLVARHVQALLASLPAPIPLPSSGQPEAARRLGYSGKVLPTPAVVVRENTISEPPRPPALREDRDRAARDLEGFVVVARDPRARKRKDVRFAEEEMLDAMDALTVVDEGPGTVTELTKSVNAMEIDDLPPQSSAMAATAPTMLVNGAKPSPVPSRSKIKPRKSNLMVQDSVRERFPATVRPFPENENDDRNITDARKHPRSSTPDDHPPKRQLKSQLSLSLFGRIFTTLGRIVTQHTRAVIAHQPLPSLNHLESPVILASGPSDADDDGDAEDLADAAARAAAAAATRREIFTAQCLATCARIRKRGATPTGAVVAGMAFPSREAVDKDLVAVCATLALTERTVRMPREEELVLCLLLVRAVEVGAGKVGEGTGLWLADALNGTGIGVVEFASLLRSLI
ncbi:RNA polymerase II associated protein 2 [Geranomyces michiganensis]|nr:RNA polymerase II associated protein 2 [Geranomyces michiganensis]